MNKNQILEVAEGLFFGKRLSDVKLSSIARSLGIKTPSLYHWFTDKEALLEETIIYSAQKFLIALDIIIGKNSPRETILWYLTFPSKTKNLFGIAFQKGFCEDRHLSMTVGKYRNLVEQRLTKQFQLSLKNDAKIYLLTTLLEKLAAENCIENNCLPELPEKIAEEIENLFFKKN